jgi:trimeric autotransporter adhesin
MLTLSVILLLTIPICSRAAELSVPAQYATIQAAIDAAANNDIITVQPGTYTENITFKGKAITLTGTNPLDPAVIATTIVDGNMNGSVVTFNSGEKPDSVLTGFTIRNGNGTLNVGDGKRYGGGIYCAGQSNPTIRHNKIINNTADTGGGIYIHGNTAPTITAGPTASYPYAGLNQTVTLTVMATDADNDTLVYKWVAREGGTVTGTGSTVSFSSATAGVRHIDLTVDDQHGGTTKATVTVTVTGVTIQTAPQLLVGQSATLSAILTPVIADSPQYPVSITWSLTQGPAAGTFDGAVNGTPSATSIALTPSASGAGRITATYAVGTVSITDTMYFAISPIVTSIEPASAFQGDTTDVVIRGNNLGRVNAISVGSGVTASVMGTPTETTLNVRFMINVDANPGARSIVLTTPEASYTASPTFQINSLPVVTANPTSLSLTTGETGSITFSIPDPAPAGGLSLILSSSATNVATVATLASIPAGQRSVTVAVNANSGGTATITANVTGYSRAQVPIAVINPPLITFSPSSLSVAKGLTETCTVSISNPAPMSGLVVTFAGDTGILYVPTTVTIPAYWTSTTFNARGLTVGSTAITATATNYPNATWQTSVVQGQLTLSPASLPVAVGRTATLTLSIPNNAPAGGLTVNIVSSNTAFATVPSTATIPEGTKSTTIQVSGVAVGSATVTAGATGFTSTQATANVQQFNSSFSPTSLVITPGTSKTADVVLSAAAPAGGLTITFTNPSPALVSLPSSVVIAEGQTRSTISVSGLDTTATPVVVSASAGGVSTAQLSVTVQQKIQPVIKADIVVGAGCSSYGVVGLSNGVSAPTGGYTINLTSSDPTIASVPATVTISQGSNYTQFNIVGKAPGSALITASAAGYTSVNTVTVVKASFQWSNIPSEMTMGASYQYVYAYTNVPNGSNYYSPNDKSTNTQQYADQPITVGLTSSNPAVLQVSATATIAAGSYSSGYMNISIQAVGIGSSNITASAPNMDIATSSSITVVNPWFYSNVTVGTGCRVSGSVGLTGGYAPAGGYMVNLTSSDPTIATIPATVTIPQGNSSASFNIVGHNPGTATITMSIGGYTTTGTVTVVKSILKFYSVPAQMTAGTSAPAYIMLYLPDNNFGSLDQAMTVTLTSSDPSVLQVPVTVTMPANDYRAIPIIQAIGGGSATITASATGFDSVTSAAISTTNPWLKADVTVGAGCSTTGVVGLTGGTAPTGGFTVNLTSSDPTIASVPATLTIPSGNSYYGFTIVGHNPGTATITMTFGSFTTTSTVTVVQSGFAWNSIPPSQMTLGVSTTLYVMTNVPSGSYYSSSSKYSNTRQNVVQPLTVTLLSSDASVIQVPVAVTIGTGSSSQSISIQAVGVGSSILTVSANSWNSLTSNPIATVGPSLKADVTVGAGCSTTGAVVLNGGIAPSGGYTVNLSSSDPTIASVPATATIVQGNSSYFFDIVGHSPGTATIMVTVGGFTATSTVTVVTPQFQFYNMPSGMNIGATANISLYTYVPGGTRYYNSYWYGAYYESYYNQPVNQSLTINLASDNPSVIQVPATATITTGSYYVYSVNIQAVGAGSATIAAEAPGWNRTVSPAITTIDWLKADVTVGAGCRTTGALGMATGSAPPGGYTVTLTSSDPTIASVPATVTIPEYNNYKNFNIVGHKPGTVTITMSSGGYTTTSTATVVKPTFRWDTYSIQMSIGAGASAYFQIYVPNGTYYSGTYKYDNTYQGVGQPLTVALTSSDQSVIQVPATVTITEGESYGYVDVLAQGLGTGTITASASDWDSATSDTITVVAPTLNANVTVGAGCQVAGSVGLTTGGGEGGSTFTLTSSDPTIASVPPTVTIYGNYAEFNIVGHSPGTATITLSVGGVSVASAVTTVVKPVFQWDSVPAHISAGTGTTVYIYAYLPGVGSQSLAEDLTITISNTNPSIIQAPATVTIPAGNVYASFEILAIGTGTSILTASAPGWDDGVTGTINTASGVWFAADVTVGTGCRTYGAIGAGEIPVPVGGYTMTLTSSDPTIVSVPDTVTILDGENAADFSITGHNTGTATITMSVNGNNYTSTVTVVKPALQWISVPTDTYIGAHPRLYLAAYVPNGTCYDFDGYKYAYTSQVVDQPLTVSLVSSNPEAVEIPADTMIIAENNDTSFQANILAVGTSTVTASAPGWDNAISETIHVDLY